MRIKITVFLTFLILLLTECVHQSIRSCVDELIIKIDPETVNAQIIKILRRMQPCPRILQGLQ